MKLKSVTLFLPFLSLMLLLFASCDAGSNATGPATPKRDPGGTPTFSRSEVVSTNSTNAPPSITCALDQNEQRIDCQVSGGSGFTNWSWASNATSKTSGGRTFVFGIEEQVAQGDVHSLFPPSGQVTAKTPHPILPLFGALLPLLEILRRLAHQPSFARAHRRPRLAVSRVGCFI